MAVTVASRNLHRQLGRSAFIFCNYFAFKSFGAAGLTGLPLLRLAFCYRQAVEQEP